MTKNRFSTARAPALMAWSGAHLLLAAGSVTGCSSVADPNDTWKRVEQRTQPYSDPGEGNWSCLTDPPPAAPTVVAGAGTTVTYRLPIVDWVGDAPVKGLSILKCAAIDGECSTPLPPGPLKPSDGRA